MSAWINHVKAYSAKHGLSYKDSLKDPQCKEQYTHIKTGEKQVEQGNKEFKQRQKTKKLLNFGEETIEIPREMALDNKVVPTLTPSNNIRKRNKIPAVSIEPTDENKINIVTDNKSHDEKFNEFRPELKQRVRARRIMKSVSGLSPNITVTRGSGSGSLGII
jgi:hypothetical protein